MATFLHSKNKPINETWELDNQNYDKEVLLATILQQYGDFGCVEEDPVMFKYYCEMWWRKHYRTFQKWMDIFDEHTNPLINNWRREEHTIEETNEGNQYNRFKNKDNVTDHHIGDAYSNEDFHNEYEDHKVTNEVIDNDATSHLGKNENTDATNSSIKTNAQTDDKTNTSIKDTKGSEDSTTNRDVQTGTDLNVATVGANYNNESSKGYTATKASDGQISGFSVNTSAAERSVETKVSAYNSSDYEPSQEEITHGVMGNSGENSSKVHTTGDKTKNTVDDDTTFKKDTTGNELNSFNEQNQMNAEEHNQGANKQNVVSTEIGKTTDDTTKDFTDDTNGENTNNKQVTSNDKFINNSNGLHAGDSQMKNNNKKVLVEKNFFEGNVGVQTEMDMMQAELKVQAIDLYNQISELFVDENCVCIFTSPWQRGGCCW